MSHSDKKLPRFTFRKTLLYSLLPTLVFLGIVEGSARLLELWKPPLTLDYGWGFNEGSRVFEPGGILRNKMVTRKEKLISFQKQSFDMPKDPNEYRILVIGGSNVNFMDYNLRKMCYRLTQRPGENRRFEIINAGGCAYGTNRILNMMPELFSYDIDLLLIYAGHNEFEEQIHKGLVDLEAIPVQKVAYSLATLRLLRDIQAHFQLMFTDVVSLRENTAPEIDGNTSLYRFSPEEIKEHMRHYQENLSSIIEQGKAQNIPIIISTVATNYWAPDFCGGHKDIAEKIQQYYNKEDYEEGLKLARSTLPEVPRHQASDTENEIISFLAEKYDLVKINGEQLIMEAEPNGIPGETLMSDRCHLTFAGREIVVRAFEEEIARIADRNR